MKFYSFPIFNLIRKKTNGNMRFTRLDDHAVTCDGRRRSRVSTLFSTHSLLQTRPTCTEVVDYWSRDSQPLCFEVSTPAGSAHPNEDGVTLPCFQIVRREHGSCRLPGVDNHLLHGYQQKRDYHLAKCDRMKNYSVNDA